ncbi:MAG TPA: FCD domain-containing protein [Anaerolineales bacterium]|nr:FCD domain-containing protein [Anaerolineales bacterium]
MMQNQSILSEFLQYLAHYPADTDSLPPLNVISKEIGISVASLREQLEVAKALGFVEVRPRTGIRKIGFNYLPSVLLGLQYALAEDAAKFNLFADLRQKIESAYWFEAVELLDENDKQDLLRLLNNAKRKLYGSPIQIPHEEHKHLHLTIYSKLNNPFVNGILEAYWASYELIGLNFFTDLDYLVTVWNYHEKMVVCIINNDFKQGYQAMREHTDLLGSLLTHKPNTSTL